MRTCDMVETSPQERLAILSELKDAITSYLEVNKNLSLNAIACRSNVSEPTLRRIKKGEVKTLPRINTIVDILSIIYKERNISSLIQKCGPHLKSYLSKVFSVLMDTEAAYENDTGLSKVLQDSTSYLIYKLAANRIGIKREQVQRNFGELGLKKLSDLERKGLVFEMVGSYHARTKSFCLDDDLFIQNFKSVADFIRIEEGPARGDNLFYNLSESVSEEGYQKIMAIQRQALKEIVSILNDKKFVGDKQAFVLSTVDYFK